MAKTIYASVSELRTYAAERGVSLLKDTGEAYTDDELSVFLTKAQDYIDVVFSFKGQAVYGDSEFPRSGLENYDETTVPPAVRKSTLNVATHIIDGLPIMEGQRATAQVKREVIASNRIETEYATNYAHGPVQGYVVLEAPLFILKRAGLIADNMGSMNFFALRG